MNRAQWRFEYTAAKLAKAADEKMAHHESRLAWWRGAKESVIGKIKDGGMTVHESLSDQNAMSLVSNRSPGYGAQMVIDPTLQRELNETGEKIAEHDTKMKQYSAWKQILEGNPEARLSLDHEDWMFFFGK